MCHHYKNHSSRIATMILIAHYYKINWTPSPVELRSTLYNKPCVFDTDNSTHIYNKVYIRLTIRIIAALIGKITYTVTFDI